MKPCRSWFFKSNLKALGRFPRRRHHPGLTPGFLYLRWQNVLRSGTRWSVKCPPFSPQFRVRLPTRARASLPAHQSPRRVRDAKFFASRCPARAAIFLERRRSILSSGQRSGWWGQLVGRSRSSLLDIPCNHELRRAPRGPVPYGSDPRAPPVPRSPPSGCDRRGFSSQAFANG
jgi:hypothetical protein